MAADGITCRWAEKTDLRKPREVRFRDGSGHHRVEDPLWRLGGELYTRNDLPPGAMFDADWDAGAFAPGPDGLWLMVRLPSGEDWAVDLPAQNSNRPWTRTGKPPTVTARPSIQTPKYHGFLTAGVLVAC